MGHQRGNTPAGSEDPSWLPCPHSQACGSQRPSTRSLAQPSSTANASKRTAAEKHHVRSYGRRKGVRRRKTLSAQPQSSISKDRCGSEELGENTDRFGTTHKDFPPTQSERRPEFASQVGFFDKKSIRDDLRTDSRYIMYLYVYIKLYFWKYISNCEMETLKK